MYALRSNSINNLFFFLFFKNGRKGFYWHSFLFLHSFVINLVIGISQNHSFTLSLPLETLVAKHKIRTTNINFDIYNYSFLIIWTIKTLTKSTIHTHHWKHWCQSTEWSKLKFWYIWLFIYDQYWSQERWWTHRFALDPWKH